MALLAAFVFAPGKAKAECGDYVMVGERHVSTANHASAQFPPNSKHVPCPCRGPNCSQLPRVPFAPSSPARVVVSIEWACVFATASDQSSPENDLAGDGEGLDPIRRAIPIFHPPKQKI
jgi:hypothetical protein